MRNERKTVRLNISKVLVPPDVPTGRGSGFVRKSRVVSPEAQSLTCTDSILDYRNGVKPLGSHFGKPEGGLQAWEPNAAAVIPHLDVTYLAQCCVRRVATPRCNYAARPPTTYTCTTEN